MNENDGDHEVGTPTVECADVPAKGDGVIESLQAVPGFAGGGDVDDGKQHASDDLHDKDNESRAAENIEPTGGFARDGMLGRFAKRGGELQTRVEPIADLLDQAHGSFPLISTSALGLLGLTGVGNSPALMMSCPSSIL